MHNSILILFNPIKTRNSIEMLLNDNKNCLKLLLQMKVSTNSIFNIKSCPKLFHRSYYET